jgi:hypothetical protein
MLHTMRLSCALALSALLIGSLNAAAEAEPDQVTCTGILTETETSTSAWPLGVIQDTNGHYFCTIDRGASGRDLLKACSLGDKCRVIGTFQKVGHTYSIVRVVSVARPE